MVSCSKSIQPAIDVGNIKESALLWPDKLLVVMSVWSGVSIQIRTALRLVIGKVTSPYYLNKINYLVIVVMYERHGCNFIIIEANAQSGSSR